MEDKTEPDFELRSSVRVLHATEGDNRQIYFSILDGVSPELRAKILIRRRATNFGPRVAMTWSPNPNGRVLRRRQVDDQRRRRYLLRSWSQSGRSDSADRIKSRSARRLSGGSYPQNPATIAARSYTNPAHRISAARVRARLQDSRRRSISTPRPSNRSCRTKLVLTAGLVGSQGRNLFLRSIANRILPGQTTILDGTGAAMTFGIVNRTQRRRPGRRRRT